MDSDCGALSIFDTTSGQKSGRKEWRGGVTKNGTLIDEMELYTDNYTMLPRTYCHLCHP